MLLIIFGVSNVLNHTCMVRLKKCTFLPRFSPPYAPPAVLLSQDVSKNSFRHR